VKRIVIVIVVSIDGEDVSVGVDARVAQDGVAGEVVLAVDLLLLAQDALGFGLDAGGRRELAGVVAVAALAFQAQPVEGRPGAARAVVAADPDVAGAREAGGVGVGEGGGAGVGRVAVVGGEEAVEVFVAFGHGLRADFVVEFPPLQFHVDGAFAADGTFVRD
jgi:hypothetical protein